MKGAVPEPAESTSHGWSLDPMKESVPAPVFVMLTLAGATLELPACPAKRKLGGLTARTAGTADELVGFTVKTTVALLLESALLVAVTSILVAELTLGAVNKPDALTVPAVADHVTAVFGVFITLAVSCRVLPETTDVFEDDAVTLTFPLPANDIPPPQPAKRSTTERARYGRSKPKQMLRPELQSLGSHVTGRLVTAACRKPQGVYAERLTFDILKQSSSALERIRKKLQNAEPKTSNQFG